MSDEINRPADRSGSGDSETIIDLQRDRFEAELRAGRVAGLKDWLASHSVSIDRNSLKELLRIDVRQKISDDANFDVTGYVSEFAVDANVVFTTSFSRDSLTKRDSGQPRLKTSRFGRFSVSHEVGRGGFGIVYLAFDELLNRSVALKIPMGSLDHSAKARFLREAEASAALDHPNIVPIFDAGELDGECFIASAYCDGQTLAEWMKSRREFDQFTRASIIRDIALGVDHAHSRGVVHRDIKPSNILMGVTQAAPKQSGDITPRITDFGLAKLVQQKMEDTHSSVLMGTPSYMAPEVLADSKTVRPELADIFAIGVMLYELLTNRRPFDDNSIVGVMDAIRNGQYRSAREVNPDVSADLDAICDKCLDQTPSDRYQSGSELARDLDLFLRHETPKARRSNRLRKLVGWMTSPRRAYETGLFSIFLGVGIPVWITLIISLVAAEGLDASITAELIPQAMLVFSLLLFPTAIAGFKTIQGSKRWRRYGFLASIINLCMVVPPLFGVILVFPEMYTRYPLGKIIAYSFLAFVFLIQVIQYAILWWGESKRSYRTAIVLS